MAILAARAKAHPVVPTGRWVLAVLFLARPGFAASEVKRKIRAFGQCPPTRLHPCPGSALIAAVDGFAAVSEGRATSSPLEEAG
jgi:hypothetical protein